MATTGVTNSSAANVFASAKGESASSTAKTAAQENAEKLQKQFLQLLLKQLEVQNPLSPVDTTEYTNQLVQYSALEQQINSNTKLDEIVAAFQQTATSNAFNYIGKKVLIEQPHTSVADGEANWAFQFNEGPESVKITIKDAAGKVVYQQDHGRMAAGSHDFILTQDMLIAGTTIEDGSVLTMTVDAADRDGVAVKSAIGTRVVVDSVDTSAKDPILGSGNLFFTAEDILKVFAVQSKASQSPATEAA